jgi:predicted phosphohydrolase
MKIFAISDLHLSTAVNKPMDIFGDGWQNHFDKIKEDWLKKVSLNDVVLLGGDISWGLTMDEAEPDYKLIAALPGKKIVLRGNHDYYWSSLSKMNARFPSFEFLQNNSIKTDGAIIAGSRGWNIPDDNASDEDKKIYARELLRLEMSLKDMQAKAVEGDVRIALLHYPPFDVQYRDSDVTKLLEMYNIQIALYGHLHGKNVRVKKSLEKNGIEYHITSCDLIDNKLITVKDFD